MKRQNGCIRAHGNNWCVLWREGTPRKLHSKNIREITSEDRKNRDRKGTLRQPRDVQDALTLPEETRALDFLFMSRVECQESGASPLICRDEVLLLIRRDSTKKFLRGCSAAHKNHVSQ